MCCAYINPCSGVLAGVHICISVWRPERLEHSCDDCRFDQNVKKKLRFIAQHKQEELRAERVTVHLSQHSWRNRIKRSAPVESIDF